MINGIKRALVVDDNASWLSTLSRLVSKYYTDIDKAGTFEEALLKIEQSSNTYDLIVTDLRLKENVSENYAGLDLIEQAVKTLPLRKSIVVTCHPSPETRKKAESLGALYFVKGIFSRESFWEALLHFEEMETVSPKNHNTADRRDFLCSISAS
jgi:DNA-binding NtrC family response regulator